MERRKSPSSLTKRPTSRKNRGVFYAQFRNETGAYRSALSTGRSNRDDAVRWCEQRLKDPRQTQTGITFKDDEKGFGIAQFMRGKQNRSRIRPFSWNALRCRSHYKKHLLPKWGDCRLRDLALGKIDSWIMQLRPDGPYH